MAAEPESSKIEINGAESRGETRREGRAEASAEVSGEAKAEEKAKAQTDDAIFKLYTGILYVRGPYLRQRFKSHTRNGAVIYKTTSTWSSTPRQDGQRINLGLIDRPSSFGGTDMELLKVDLALAFLTITEQGPTDWREDWATVCRRVVPDPQRAAKAYEIQRSFRNGEIQCLLTLDAIFLASFLLFSLSRSRSGPAMIVNILNEQPRRIIEEAHLQILEPKNQVPLDLIRNVYAILIEQKCLKADTDSGEATKDANVLLGHLCSAFVGSNGLPRMKASTFRGSEIERNLEVEALHGMISLNDTLTCEHLLHCQAEAVWASGNPTRYVQQPKWFKSTAKLVVQLRVLKPIFPWLDPDKYEWDLSANEKGLRETLEETLNQIKLQVLELGQEEERPQDRRQSKSLRAHSPDLENPYWRNKGRKSARDKSHSQDLKNPPRRERGRQKHRDRARIPPPEANSPRGSPRSSSSAPNLRVLIPLGDESDDGSETDGWSELHVADWSSEAGGIASEARRMDEISPARENFGIKHVLAIFLALWYYFRDTAMQLWCAFLLDWYLAQIQVTLWVESCCCWWWTASLEEPDDQEASPFILRLELASALPTARELNRYGVSIRGHDAIFPKFERRKFRFWRATLFLPELSSLNQNTRRVWRCLLAFEEKWARDTGIYDTTNEDCRENVELTHKYMQRSVQEANLAEKQWIRFFKAYRPHPTGRLEDSPRRKPFLSYLQLMDDLINTEDDVEILSSGSRPVILTHSLGDHKAVAEFFNCVTQDYSTACRQDSPEWVQIIEKINKFHNSKNRRLILEFVEDKCKPWVLVSILVASLLLAGTALQTIYTVQGYYHPH